MTRREHGDGARRIRGLRRIFHLPLRGPVRIAEDVDDELRFHLEMRARELIEQGMTPSAARDEALRQFGDVERTRSYCRDEDMRAANAERRSELMHDALQDVTYAWRKLRKSPAFTLIAALTLALGIGANTAIFSVVDGVLLRSLPYDEPSRIVRIASTRNGKGSSVSWLDFVDFRAQNRSFDAIAVIDNQSVNLTGAGADPLRVDAAGVTANFFTVLRTRPELGRTFAADEGAKSAPKVALLSDALWRSRFNADRSVIGQTILLGGEPYTIIGVMPSGIEYPANIKLWYPHVPQDWELDPANRGAHFLDAVGLLKRDVTLARAEQDMRAVAAHLAQLYPSTNANRSVHLTALRDYIIGPIRTPLLVLLGAVGFVLLIACANVANLLLVRASGRGSEIAIRTALGAGRARLVRQLITESMLLSVIGGAAGIALAAWGTATLVRLGPKNIPRLDQVHLDGGVLAFTALITLATGFIFGLLPAMQASTPDLAGALRAGSRGTRTHRASRRMRDAIVVAEVALAVILLVGAGLLIRSFAHLLAVDPGYRADHVTTFELALPDAKYPKEETQRVFVAQLVDRLRELPGVQSAAVVVGRPLGNHNSTVTYEIAGQPELPAAQQPAASVRIVTADYLKTMGIRLIRGRAFSDADRKGTQRVVMINQEMARRDFPGKDPVGATITMGWSTEEGSLGGEIVGVVSDVKQFALDRGDEPEVYGLYDQFPLQSLNVVIRSTTSTAAVLGAARETLKQLDAALPMAEPQTMESVISDSVARPRFYTLLLGIFAVVALGLAAVGLYGVIAYAVSQRTHEIGIRIALGATRDKVIGMIVRQGMQLTLVGIVIGGVLALVVMRVMSTLLFGVSNKDPLTFVGVSVVLLAIAILASAIPARRAARVDPVIALRE